MAWAPTERGHLQDNSSLRWGESYGSSAASTAVSIGPAVETQEPPNIDLSQTTDASMLHTRRSRHSHTHRLSRNRISAQKTLKHLLRTKQI